MQKQWMNPSILSVSIGLALGSVTAHAAPAAKATKARTVAQQRMASATQTVTTQQAEAANEPVAVEARQQIEAPLTGDNNPHTPSNVGATVAERADAGTTSPNPPATDSMAASSASGSSAPTANGSGDSAANAASTPSMAPQTASSALQQKADDASARKNLEEVFTRSEQQYSLSKQGSYSATYDLDYTYYRDSRLDLALSDSSSALTRLRVEEDAQHSLTNTFTFQYGLLNNFTITASLPLVAKSDNLKDSTTTGLGDISFGARWEPFPLKPGKLPLILFGSLSTKTGDSPYEVDPVKGLSTGKGYYSIGGGASTRKFIDPVVLFGSASLSYGFKEGGIDQNRSGRILDSFSPGISGGMSFGFAYSFNYDVSLTMSYQQSFSTGSEFTFKNGDVSKPADQTSASLGFSLGVRVSPQTIVNTSVGLGLTEDAPDVSLGLSFPLDFLGFGREVR